MKSGVILSYNSPSVIDQYIYHRAAKWKIYLVDDAFSFVFKFYSNYVQHSGLIWWKEKTDKGYYWIEQYICNDWYMYKFWNKIKIK